MLLIAGAVTVMILIFCGLIYLTKHHKNYEKRKDLDSEYIKTVCINYIISCSVALILITFRSYIFVDSLIPSIQTIIFYFIVIDTISYWLHRTIHRTPFLKELLHGTHHDVFHLIPFDAFHIYIPESLLYITLIYIVPLLFIPVNIIEYYIVFTIVSIHELYIHSEYDAEFIIPPFINSTFHKYHHQIGKGNYSIFFPFWDNYMETRIPTPAKKKNRSNRRKRGLLTLN
jgi:sterol desaturase/sphingolipid hydroxylase (fatty acid hydroxylase superfamily)